ncbi:hypothetical protein [Pseudoroseicyclus sp. CXY001]|uniref:hypothetical protein n=1 Tax=Pseudoroseicyclus sp. CXY001 TaxID=3242492 RepID=UPI00357146CE
MMQSHAMPQPARKPAQVSWIDPSEVARIDPAPLLRLQGGLGPQLTADLLRRTREDLAYLTASARAAQEMGDNATLARFGRRIEVLALQIGMRTLRRAAANLANCADGLDPHALAATFARLERLAQSAVQSIGAVRISDL